MEKRFWIIIGIIAVIFVGILWASGDKNKDNGNTGDATQASTHIKGKTDAKVRLVEYGDFQCPTCGAYYPLTSAIVEKYKDSISFQFRNLPLSQIHQHAFAAARAAEAASLQNKYWEMYDTLFQNQTTWSIAATPTDSFKQYAVQLGLNSEQYATDFASDTVNKTINNDIAAFNKLSKEKATPTFFINDKKISLKDISDDKSQPSLEKFSQLIDDALKAQGN